MILYSTYLHLTQSIRTLPKVSIPSLKYQYHDTGTKLWFYVFNLEKFTLGQYAPLHLMHLLVITKQSNMLKIQNLSLKTIIQYLIPFAYVILLMNPYVHAICFLPKLIKLTKLWKFYKEGH